MRVFLTGATGFIGSHIIPELLDRGHQVLGLTRSDAGARQLEAAGVDVHRGNLEMPETLARAVLEADAVIHCAFDHDFANFVENTKKDERNIAAMGEALEGTRKPILITSGVGIGTPLNGGPATEDVLNPHHANPRIATELAGAALMARRIDVRTIRLPQVHDTTRAGLITPLTAEARRAGAVAYVGEGQARWSAAHVSDVAKLYVLALEKGEPGARYHASAEEGVTARAIAEAIGKGSGLPVRSVAADEVEHYFGWMSPFVSLDMTASNAWTRARIGWVPTGPDLLTDLAAMDYSVITAA
ncbi:SDR family oxidoreductase [Granulibacter bethesdensis]|uniref:Nucleoside-diphosphate-sugar epimerase n=1 Tax=Granulibacter bethesdensis (strain ATCC BAA-1260 / CGDNIH1) TaxID=391165 RepID=Q0BR71_GRABC|nr:SDR family oxidoreductase [Granulibacter bethesdensis]ABI62681.1 Nucleoside-diphosphate-sugar epimerase [Granulibacter bethesdensis CGDNIH1]APG30727.1 Nucleoside-diphosphate-sugar epimerase [Granulibacter bethesdensis]APH52539.1 Nucleoside-diphosphate-sugar epimerase [Granulibacter bethesdensis]APH65228.1 Nucleoside-diphosphate-sugar epimerase [Granulibacter bethesdensis]